MERLLIVAGGPKSIPAISLTNDTRPMRVAVFGAGLVGRRVAKSLANHNHDVVLVSQSRTAPTLAGVTSVTGWPQAEVDNAAIVVLATASMHHYAVAKELVGSGVHVVSTADEPNDVERLWSLDSLARTNESSLVLGAAYSPGLTSLLVNVMARDFDEISAISTAQFGTGGPACAREHHRSMSRSGREVHDGALRIARAGTGRQLVWFPEPVGAADCYRAGLSDPILLQHAFPHADRIESRQAATRRDRMTARLPMLRSPHAEGLVGAVWAEVRGRIDGRVEHRVMGASGPQATGAAAVAAAVAHDMAERMKSEGKGSSGGTDEGMRLGVSSVASVSNPSALLQLVSSDVRLWTYDGARSVTTIGVAPPIHAARKWRAQRTNP